MLSNKKSLLILFSVVVLDLVGFGIVIPILPFYAEAYGADATLLGFLLTSYAAMQFLFAPMWGKLSDKMGRKKILLWTMVGSALGLIILGLAQSLVWLFVGRILSGIFAGNIGIASAYVSDVTSQEDRARGMGLIGAAFGIGFILGPAIGGGLSPYGYSVPILGAAVLTLINILYAGLILPHSPHHHDPLKESGIKVAVLKNPAVIKMCLLTLFFTICVTQLETLLAFFMKDTFNYDARQVAYVLVLMAFVMVFIQGGIIKQLVARFGERSLLITGLIILSVAFFMIPSPSKVSILLIPLCIISVGRGISQPSMLSLVSKATTEHLQGSVIGTFQSASSLGRIIGPLIAGALYDRSHTLPFYFAGGLMGLVVIFVGSEKFFTPTEIP